MGKSNNNDKKEITGFFFFHAFLIVPLRSYENIFLEVSTPQIFLCFLYIFLRCDVGGQIMHFNEICLLTLYFPRARNSTSSDLKLGHGPPSQN